MKPKTQKFTVRVLNYGVVDQASDVFVNGCIQNPDDQIAVYDSWDTDNRKPIGWCRLKEVDGGLDGEFSLLVERSVYRHLTPAIGARVLDRHAVGGHPALKWVLGKVEVTDIILSRAGNVDTSIRSIKEQLKERKKK